LSLLYRKSTNCVLCPGSRIKTLQYSIGLPTISLFVGETQYSMNSRALFNTAPDETNSSFFLLGMYNPDPFSPLRSPLLFPTGHRNLPPAYFIIAGSDAWRDVGLLYEEILREDCGIKTKVDVFPGLPHGFWSIFPQTQFSKDHAEKSLLGLKWLLEQTDEK
jgi:acetyl esterase/lipase